MPRTAFLVGLVALVLGPVAQAQTGTVAGRVTDAQTGETLPGVNVVLEGTRLGAASGPDGRFRFEAPAGSYTLQASFIGYERFSRAVTVEAGQTVEVEVRLRPDILGLDEVVVVGYGTQERRTVGGAVSTLRAETVREVPVASLDNALQGRLAGVQVTQNSGVPGAALTVRIRGATSITAGNQPLYVIDGVPVNQGDFSGITGNMGGQNVDAIADLNPNDIESIEVLKDASAAAIYGSRASNGVVLITTRRGRAGAPRVTLSSYAGQQRAWRIVPMLNAEQYLEVANEAYFQEFGVPNRYGFEGSGAEIEFPRVDTDWLRTVIQPAPIASTSLGIEGGDVRTRYAVTGSYFLQEGIVRPYGYERLNGRVNLDYEVSERVRFGTNVGLTRAVTSRARGDNTIYGPFANAIANPPVEPVFADDDETEYFPTLYDNPVAIMRENEAQDVSFRVIGNLFGEADLAPGLVARVSLGLDNLNLRSRLYDSPRTSLGAGFGGRGIATSSNVTNVVYEATLSYAGPVGPGAFSGVVGTSYERQDDLFESVTGTVFPTDEFRYITSAASVTQGSSSRTGNSLFSVFGRSTYTLADRYSVTLNLRADGSSRFGADNRYGFFPSVAFAWNAYEEPFLRNQDVVTGLRFRISYGLTGNQLGIGNFASRSLFGGAAYAGLPGIAPSQLGNPTLSWESTAQFNVGTEFSVLGDRLGISADYYVKNTDNLLVNVLIPSTNGFVSYTGNIGSIRNVGFEITTRATLLRGTSRRLGWTVDVNAATNANTVTALFNDQPLNFGFASRVEVGQPLGFFFGYRTDGLFQIGDPICRTAPGETPEQRNARCAAEGLAFQNRWTEPGDIRFRDLNGDGVINADDRERIGNPWPKWTGGLTNTFSYRGLDVTAFLQFSYGNDILNATRLYTDAYGFFGANDNHTTRALDRWRAPELDADGNPIPGTGNTNTREPRASFFDDNQNSRISDRFIEDGSYLRLKNLIVGYSLPSRLVQPAGVRSARVYVQGQNLITLTRYSGFDPEVNYAGSAAVTRGTDFYTLPQARTLTVGFTLGL